MNVRFSQSETSYKKNSLVSLSIHALSMMVSCLVKSLQKDDVSYIINTPADFLTLQDQRRRGLFT